ncbi:hypothetical protein DPEC_G00134680 [Dallia pectoralis]|uniref:Uncharacterized protein n=1 Tax=Dallia pectoralis TaxID=75939 RepID=A0ACC2GRU6_DALPE|nr:hypothetical protein DPEC_G00134680 [Dallia pectoralis]
MGQRNPPVIRLQPTYILHHSRYHCHLQEGRWWCSLAARDTSTREEKEFEREKTKAGWERSTPRLPPPRVRTPTFASFPVESENWTLEGAGRHSVPRLAAVIRGIHCTAPCYSLGSGVPLVTPPGARLPRPRTPVAQTVAGLQRQTDGAPLDQRVSRVLYIAEGFTR